MFDSYCNSWAILVLDLLHGAFSYSSYIYIYCNSPHQFHMLGCHTINKKFCKDIGVAVAIYRQEILDFLMTIRYETLMTTFPDHAWYTSVFINVSLHVYQQPN